MSIKSFCVIVVLILFLGTGALANENTIAINYPPDKTVREYEILGVSVDLLKDSIDIIEVIVNGNQISLITPHAETECFSVSIEPGINIIELVFYKGDKIIDRVVREVFRRSDLISEYKKVPADFKKDNFHVEDRKKCTKCHVLESSDYDVKPLNPATFSSELFDSKTIITATSTCYSCHKQMVSYPFVHGPVSVWSCLSCHEAEATPRYSVKQPDTQMCYACHIEQKMDWESKKYAHGPVTIGKCTICHSPHASKNAFNLFKSTWDLCINCHAERADGLHVIGDTMFKEGHPTRGRKDPVRIGKELTCASCHNPHASNFPHLWAFEVNDLFELCLKCHKNYSTQ